MVRGAPQDAARKGKGAAVDDIFEGAKAAGAEQVGTTALFELLAEARGACGWAATWKLGLHALWGYARHSRRCSSDVDVLCITLCCNTSMRRPCLPTLQGSVEDMYDDEHEGGHFKAFSGTARTLAGAPPAGWSHAAIRCCRAVLPNALCSLQFWLMKFNHTGCVL